MTAPAPRMLPSGQYDTQPRVLNASNGKWVQDEIPMLIAESQAQPLCSTSTFTASLPGSGAQRAIRPLTAIYSYNDISPVAQADMVVDTDLEVTLVKESTMARPRSAVSASLRAEQLLAAAPKVDTALARTGLQMFGSVRSTSVRTPDVRTTSISSFFQRQSGASFNLAIPDLERVEELGRNVPPGSANTRLVGGRWKYIARPVDGDCVYTDYYGRCGEEFCNYYGRAYHVAPAQFRQSRLVGDLDYTKVQASMPGIHTLRNRPGLTLDATIVNGPAEKLHNLSASQAKTARGLHKLHEFARLKPYNERELRASWQS
eukprot:CAMPEP_0119113532 /NCGR_PEP_ID=MMETSP1180-20130426/44332_1 /TAXON_ID=3052 ORGANISM="Chlamydomonas cf sp, Strain CCMP681" /NCGR_SAMPLE_ID=MMETSP1180 /ASSEMBLY_ACC=CAM_ASM_000741 /LENGTH=316 /DNA_ID=CAMNT_0007101669 /DNA_START=171 /DNA_END=1121 /DNA_ORIENTATION=+